MTDRLEKIKSLLQTNIHSVIEDFFPNAVLDAAEQNYKLGDVYGNEGQSLSIVVESIEYPTGTFKDFATEQKGDIIDLFALMLEIEIDFDKKYENKARPWLQEVLKEGEQYFINQINDPLEEKIKGRKQKEAKEEKIEKNSALLAGSYVGEKKTTEYIYTDIENNPVFKVTRIDPARSKNESGKVKKVFWQSSYIGGNWVKGIKTPDRILYNLPGIYKEKQDYGKNAQIYIVEGEKSADILISLGFTATTFMGGSNATIVTKTLLSLKVLIDCRVTLIPDNDEGGKAFMDIVFNKLKLIDVYSVEILAIEELPLKPKDDLKDKLLLLSDVKKNISPIKPKGWDIADGIAEENFNLEIFLRYGRRVDNRYFRSFSVPLLQSKELQNLATKEAPDLIQEGFLTESESFIIAGAPKIGKSTFVLSMALHFAIGKTFLNWGDKNYSSIKPTRPLRILNIQTEVHESILATREAKAITSLSIEPEDRDKTLALINDNILHTARNKSIKLDEAFIDALIISVAERFKGNPVDIIILDPFRDLFLATMDGGNESDNSNVLKFLNVFAERLRERLNPRCGIFIIHHTNKAISKMKDPSTENDEILNEVAGASSLRGYGSGTWVLYRTKLDETNYAFSIASEYRARPPQPLLDIYHDNGGFTTKIKPVVIDADKIDTKAQTTEEEAKELVETLEKLIIEALRNGDIEKPYTTNKIKQAIVAIRGARDEFKIADVVEHLKNKLKLENIDDIDLSKL